MSKITVGIFGDSYANAEHGHEDFPNMRDNAWFYHLGEEYEATSYGVGGASNYYSYAKFLEHHNKYDKNIFLITYPGRHPSSEIVIEKNPKFDYLGKGPGVDMEYGKVLFPSSAGTSDYLLTHASEYNFNSSTLRKLNAIRDYYMWLEHREYDQTVTELLIDHIKRIRPDTLFINLFYERFYKEPADKWGAPLVTSVTGPTFLNYLDSMVRGLDSNWSKQQFPHEVVSKYFEIRCTCHFSQEANLIIARDVRQALITGNWNPSIPNTIEHTNADLGYYYNLKNPIQKNDVPGH